MFWSLSWRSNSLTDGSSSAASGSTCANICETPSSVVSASKIARLAPISIERFMLSIVATASSMVWWCDRSSVR